MMRIKKIPLVSPLKTKTLLPILGSTISLRIGDIIFNLGLHSGLAKIVAPIAGAYPVLFVILAFFVFKDPIKKQQMIGIVVTLLGIVLLSIISV